MRGHCTTGSQWSARMELISCSGSVWVRHEWGYLWEQSGPVDETMWVNLEGGGKRRSFVCRCRRNVYKDASPCD